MAQFSRSIRVFHLDQRLDFARSTQNCRSVAFRRLATTENNGSSTRKELPRPSWLETFTSALCAAQIALTMESPNPAPPLARERALSAR